MNRLETVCRLVGQGVPIAEAARSVLDGRESRPRPAEPAGPAEPAEPRSDSVPARPDSASARAGGGHTLPSGRQVGASGRGLARCAIRLDAPAVLEMLESELARNGVLTAWQDTIQPALAAVGRKWTESDGRYVEAEHLLSWCITVALHRTSAPTPQQNSRPGHRGVLLACAADDWHSLSLEVLAAALAEHGVPIRMLGPAVPGRALLEAARRTGPAAAVVWSQSPRTADASVLQGLTTLPGLRVFAAGPGWCGRQPIGADALTSLPAALAALV
jgi:hypothetical protein